MINMATILNDRKEEDFLISRPTKRRVIGTTTSMINQMEISGSKVISIGLPGSFQLF
jgi:hypothetical protein